MSVRKEQSKFVRAIADLIIFAYQNGYELTFGDAWARGGHKKDSLHYNRLAIDFNLFKNGKYLTDTSDHLPIGEYWEKLGGTWGGRFKNQDGNHYQWGDG